MFAGSRTLASESLRRIVLESAKRALAPGFTWNYASELKMLAVLQEKTEVVVNNALVDFVELPTKGWRYITQKGDTKFPTEKMFDLTIAQFSLLWDSHHKHSQRKMKVLKAELLKEFNLIETSWRKRDYEPSPRIKKVRRRKTKRTPADSVTGGRTSSSRGSQTSGPIDSITAHAPSKRTNRRTVQP